MDQSTASGVLPLNGTMASLVALLLTTGQLKSSL